MFNIGNSTHRCPTLVLPTQLTSIKMDTSTNLVLHLSITPKTASRDIYSGLCNVTVPDGNNNMIMEEASGDEENKQPTSSSMTKRKIDTNSKDLSEDKIQKYDHTKQLDTPLNSLNSPIIHTNNTDSRGLHKEYKEEEYACGLFLAQLASAKMFNDHQNVILANNTISESNKPQTSIDNSGLKIRSLTYCSIEERNSRKSVQEIGHDDGSNFKCVFGMERAKHTLLELSKRSYKCKQCKQHFLTLPAFQRHLVKRKTNNVTTTGESTKNGNKVTTRHNLNCKCNNCKSNNYQRKYSQRLLNMQNKIFQCKDCKKTFLKFDDFSKHLIQAHSKFNCGNCSISNKYYRLIHDFKSNTRKFHSSAVNKDVCIPENQAATHTVRNKDQNSKKDESKFQNLSNLDTLALVANNIQYNENEFTNID